MEHGAVGVPTTEIMWQAINLSILIGAIIYFVRKPAIDFFRQRREQFLAEAQKSQAAKMEAEKQYLEIRHRLEKLEANRDEDMARAQAEAVDLRKQMVKEAQEAAARIRQEAESTVNIEIQRAKLELHQQFVKEAVTAARTVLTKDLGAPDQQRLESDFMKNIQAVHP